MIGEQLIVRDTRQRALEALLVAHVFLDPTCLDGRRRPRLSPTAAALLDVVRTERVRQCLLAEVVISLRVARHVPVHSDDEPDYVHLLQCTAHARYRDVVRLAQLAESLSAMDLGYLRRDVVLSLLGAVERKPRANYVPPKKTDDSAIAPWKRRRKTA